jgi:CelD/BcsL family acetyltransferase involved in cellulose biosynthesis
MTEMFSERSFGDISGIWSRLLLKTAINTPFQLIEFLEIWFGELGYGNNAHILHAEGSTIEGIAPLKSEGRRFSFLGDQDVCDFADFLITPGQEIGFFNGLLDYLLDVECSSLKLFSIPEDSLTLTVLPKMARERGYKVDVCSSDVVPGMELPDTWEQFLSNLSKKNRHELRRKFRRLETVKEVVWLELTEPDEVQSAMDDFLRLLRMSGQDKEEFLTPNRDRFFRQVAYRFAEQGILRLFFLEIKGEKVSGVMCFDYGNSRFLYNSGYNPELGYYSVGLLLKAFSIRNAIEAGLNYYDFLRGNEPYKYDLGGIDRRVFNLNVEID